MLDDGTADCRQFQRRAGTAAALALVALAVWMLGAFVGALIWAVILAIATWPIFITFRARMGPTLGGAALTLLIAIAVLVPLVVAAIEVARESFGIVQWILDARRNGTELPPWIAHVPLIGEAAAGWLQARLQSDGNLLDGSDIRSLSEWGQLIGRQAVRRIITLLFALLTVFFMFRHSEVLIRQFDTVGQRLFGARAHGLGLVAASAVRSTVDGLLLVGLAEAVLFGIAYRLSDIPHPALFGALTGALSVVPFAGPVALAAAIVWLLMGSQVAVALGLAIFGSLVIFVADHFIRPVLIGGAARLPFVWVLFGILGGVETFGLLGLFLGPVLLAVLITLWRELARPADGVPPAHAAIHSAEHHLR